MTFLLWCIIIVSKCRLQNVITRIMKTSAVFLFVLLHNAELFSSIMMKCLTSVVLLSFASFLTFLMPCLFWFHGGLVPNDTFYFITSLFMTASRQRWPQTHLAASALPLGRCIFNPREYLTQSEVWQHTIKSVFQPSWYEHTNIQWEMKQNMPVSAERETHILSSWYYTSIRM